MISFLKTGQKNHPGALFALFKEHAEHIMLVDHARNDIGISSLPGTVVVDELLQVESYSNVHHLISQVSGCSRPGVTSYSALAAAFPIATLVGTPKLRAMQIISELEAGPRGIFGGAVFRASLSGSMNSAVAIRGAYVASDQLSFHTGSGIVYDSRPEQEYQEHLWKARPLLECLTAIRGTCQ